MTPVPVNPGMERLQRPPGCPSVLDIARCEAGDLPDGLRTTLQTHAGACARCGGILTIFGCARLSLLGPTPHEQCSDAHRAATLLLALVEKKRLALS
ncbi:MAG TPA: hypothetical protein VGP07_16795 [Polyangia bacterium]